ncbi:placenta-specific gene 8 protein-like [Antennarius striatus]|uniref:placenta-specific gene 8 protein-like n=1 Tax=Antennarius striatus TaxID=241820 RepID=UPI0035B295BE
MTLEQTCTPIKSCSIKPARRRGEINSSSFTSSENPIMAVTIQPGRYERSEFQTGLCDTCDDCGTCCYGFLCYPCLGCSIASDMGECCLCGLGMPIRSVYRTKYNIEGSMCSDFMTAMFCPLCATCQLKRDIDRRKEQGIF